MKFTPTKLEGCFVVEPKIFNDERGYFLESYNENVFQNGIGAQVQFVQDNQSFSTKGVLRGLHYQTGDHAQAKLVRVLHGEVLDVAVDIRPSSKTYGEHVSVLLSAENQKQLFVPRGFAHGFLVVSNTATFFYKCDNLNIDWKFPKETLIISDKDLILPTFEKAKKVW